MKRNQDDLQDTAGWDTERHGRMADHATRDSTIHTVTDGDETGDEV